MHKYKGILMFDFFKAAILGNFKKEYSSFYSVFTVFHVKNKNERLLR